MPEPERKIEKLLRAFAKRRRADAGEPFQMHPVTRNLLQREVSQRAKSAPAKDNFLARIFSSPKPRLIFALSVVAVVAVAAALVIPSLTPAKQRASSLAKNIPETPALLATAPTAEAPAKREVAADKTEGMRAKLYYGTELQPVTPPASVAAAPIVVAGVSPEQTKAASDEGKFLAGSSIVTATGGDGFAVAKPAESLLKQNLQDQVVANDLKVAPDRLARYAAEGAKEKTEVVTNSFALADVSALGQLAESSDLRDSKKSLSIAPGVSSAGSARTPESQRAGTALGVPVAAKPASGTSGLSNLGNFARVDADDLLARQTHGGGGVGGNLSTSGAVNFSQTTAAFRFENRKDLSGKDAGNRAVLASFQIVQNGDEVQVIDGDGSVYSGHFYSPETDRARAFYKIGDAEKKLSEPKDAEEEQSRRAKTPAFAATRSFQSAASAPLESFQVTGTNRTLNAVVVLNGRFLEETNLAIAGTNQSWFVGGKLDVVTQTNVAPARSSNSRISGTARVGGQEIPIEARRVAP